MECKLVSKLKLLEEKGKTDQGDSACTTHTDKTQEREFWCGIVRKNKKDKVKWLEDALNWKLDGGWVANKKR